MSSTSTDIVLPSLTQWTEDHITAVLQATSQSDFTGALDAFLSKDAEITVNGVCISRADFAKQIQSEQFDEATAIVTFAGTVGVPANQQSPVEAGSVGVFYTATVQQRIRVRDAPVSSTVTASVNVVIEQDLSIPLPPSSPIRGFFDRRRVKVLNQVFTDVPVPFFIPGGPIIA